MPITTVAASDSPPHHFCLRLQLQLRRFSLSVSPTQVVAAVFNAFFFCGTRPQVGRDGERELRRPEVVGRNAAGGSPPMRDNLRQTRRRRRWRRIRRRPEGARQGIHLPSPLTTPKGKINGRAPVHPVTLGLTECARYETPPAQPL